MAPERSMLRSEAVLNLQGVLLGTPWRPLRVTWSLWKASWAPPGVILAVPGARFELFWRVLEAAWGALDRPCGDT